MLIELVAVGEGYTVVVTAAGSGNRLRFRIKKPSAGTLPLQVRRATGTTT